MANEIERISVAEEHFTDEWGVKVYDYKYLGVKVDLQDLLVTITQHRATSIENEVMPLQEIISRRNKRLERYGAVLQKLTELQATYTGQEDGTTEHKIDITGVLIPGEFEEADFWAVVKEIGYEGSGQWLTFSKSEVEGAVARCKNDIDEMNNDSQRDMTRLQSLVDRRDESYSAATSLMTSVSDTRSGLIKNLN